MLPKTEPKHKTKDQIIETLEREVRSLKAQLDEQEMVHTRIVESFEADSRRHEKSLDKG